MKNGDHFHKLQAVIMPVLLLVAISGAAFADGPGYSYGDGESKNAACMTCHGDQARVDKARFIDPKELGRTTHSKFGCATCHDAVTASHPDGRGVDRTTSCGDCHGDVVTQYANDFHAQKVSCRGCHDPHRVYRAADISADEMNRQCGSCHREDFCINCHQQGKVGPD